MKVYSKSHKSKKALNSHIDKIEKRGGMYYTQYQTIFYAFTEDERLPENINELVKDEKVTYRGTGMDWYGEQCWLIKIKRREFLISDKQFSKLRKIARMRFSAPQRTDC